MIDQLNETFGIEEHVAFETGMGGFPRAVIQNGLASAEIYLHGAHVTSFQPLGAALHSYFSVADIDGVSIDGLQGRDYLDQLDGHRVRRTEGVLLICGEVDRVYTAVPGECTIFEYDGNQPACTAFAGIGQRIRRIDGF